MHLQSTDLQQGCQDLQQWGKDRLFKKWCWENWISTCKRKKLAPYFSPYTEINTKWIKVLNIRLETLKFLEKKTRENLIDIDIGKIFKNNDAKSTGNKQK